MKQNRCAGFILIAVVYVMAALLAVFIYRAAESQTLISRIFMAEKRLLVR